MPRYIEVVGAASETATKIIALRQSGARHVHVTTNGGRTASVDWGLYRVTLNMPSLPPDAVLTRGEADRLVAFIAHECCHVLHSDKDAWQDAVKDGARVQAWTNALEDVRIEAKEIGIGAFPAMRELLGDMANHLHYESVIDSAKVGRIIGASVEDAPYVACILGRVANGCTIPAAADLDAGMSPQVRQLIDIALAGVPGCRGTHDVLRLARQLVDIERQQQPPRQDGEDGEDGEGQGGEGQGQDGEDGEGQGGEGQGQGGEGQGQGGEGQGQGQGQGGEGQGQGGEGQGQDGEGQGQGQGQPGNSTGPGTLGTDVDLSRAIDKIAARAGIDDPDMLGVRDNSHRLSLTKTKIVQPNYRGLAVNHDADAKALTERLPRNSVLHGQIGRLLVSDEVRRQTHHESSGRLDRRALARMRVGATDVYSRRDDTPGIDTALMILIDASVSMRASIDRSGQVSRMDMAQVAAWHIARAAETANAKVAVASFHSPPDNARGATLRVIKPWQDTCAQCASRLANTHPDSTTPLAPSILGAAGMLAEVNATRHILMVLTDGDCDYGAEAVKAACRLAADIGVETVGIGMACQQVTEAFPPKYSVNVVDLTQLAATGLGVLCAMLEDANPRGAD